MKKKLSAILLSIALTISTFAGIPTQHTNAANTVALGVNPFTNITYTHNSIFEGKNIYLGIDVSYYQGNINWEKVKAAGVQFVFLRLGYRGSSTGNLTLDINFQTYAQEVTAAGIPFGVYFYTEAINENEAALEAAYCIEQLKDYQVTLPVVYDYENAIPTGRREKANLSKKKATNLCKSFCATIAAGGYTPMIYANKTDLTNLIDGAELEKSYKIWLANYTKKTTYAGAYEYWQYSSSGKIDGISGKVDCNFWYTSLDINNPVEETKVNISEVTIASIPNQTYTGSPIKPELTLTYKDAVLEPNKDYKLTYSNNTASGKATVTITGKGDFTGSVTKTFKISPKNVVNFKKKSGNKQITLTWEESPSATGYTIYRKNLYTEETYTKIKNISKNTQLTWTDTGLEDGREYFYAIRAYTKVGTTKYYSDYRYVTGNTFPGTKKATILEESRLYKKVVGTGKGVVTVPKNSKVTYIGRTYTAEDAYVHHIKYTVKEKTYNGYVPETIPFAYSN